MNSTRSLAVAEFVLGLSWTTLPPDIQRQALRCVLDLCGCGLAGSRTRVAAILRTYVRETYGPGGATVIGSQEPASSCGATLANAFAVSALDLDDGDRLTKGHPGAVIFPAALAAAQEAGRSGAEFLTAVVAGYEVAMRAGRILHPLYRVYHGTGAWGPIGAAAAAARLLGCDAGGIWHAMGIAEFHAPMTPEMRSVDHPSMLKDGIGWGAAAGMAAARLAALGFTGIPSLFDAGDPADALTKSLGQDYLIERLYVKPYPCCRWAQPAITGALHALRELHVAAPEVARVRVHTFEAATHLRVTAPATTEQAQFSLPWAVACALAYGTVSPEHVLESGLKNPLCRELAARVEMVVDTDLERSFPARALARVEVESVDGRRVTSPVVGAPGDPDTVLSDEALEEKFHHLADPVVGPTLADEIIHAVHRLPEARDMAGVAALLSAPSPGGPGGLAPSRK